MRAPSNGAIAVSLGLLGRCRPRKLRTTQTVSGRWTADSASENGGTCSSSSNGSNPQAEAYHRLNGLLESVINLLTGE